MTPKEKQKQNKFQIAKCKVCKQVFYGNKYETVCVFCNEKINKKEK